MREVASLFNYIAKQVFASKFVWSDYNRGEWQKFVDLRSSGLEGGACMFSFEDHAEFRDEGPASFQGLGVGVPTGMFPYSLWLNHKDDPPALLSAVASYGPYSLDLISDD